MTDTTERVEMLAARITPETDWYEFDQVTWCNAAAALLRTQAERFASLEAERDRLREEVERLRADGERLDHIEKRARCDPKMDGQHVWWPTSFNQALKGPTLRAAIDAAIKGANHE